MLYRENDLKIQEAQSMMQSLVKSLETNTLSKISQVQGELWSIKNTCTLKNTENNEGLSSVRELLEESSLKSKKVHSKTAESIQTMETSIVSQAQTLKSFQSSMKNYEATLKSLTSKIQNLSQSPQSPPRPSTPLLPILSNPSITTELFESKLQSISEEFDEKIKKTTETLKTYIQSNLSPLESLQTSLKSTSEASLKEIQDKLAWLPINLSQLSKMSPVEARLFTVEARLRSEENLRMHSFNHLYSLLNVPIPTQTEKSMIEEENDNKLMTPIIEIINTGKKPRKMASPGGMCTSEYWKVPKETERKHWSESEIIHGVKVKFSSPVPEIEDTFDLHSKYKEQRRTKAYPNSANSNFGMLRMRSSVATKYLNLKNAVKNVKFS